jgi:hypothetical protein
MKNNLLKIILTILIVVYSYIDIFPQIINDSSLTGSDFSRQTSTNLLYKKNEVENPTLPLAIGLVSILYFVNPIILLEDKRVSAGLTKEISLGFGYFGEYRIGAEYSIIIRESQRNHLRLSLKYDLLLKDVKPSNMLQSSSVISIGGGYFTDFDGYGFFPELSFGYSIRNDKFLFYPHLKLRHTIMTEKNKANITDFSFGILIGFANPFIDLKIRNKH